jgi:hypothetical protein
MVEKRIAQSKSCEECGRGCHFKEAFEKLGCADGPSITRDVSLAFLLPILAFVVFLGGLGWLLRDLVGEPYQTPLAAGMALPATVALMLVVRFLMRRRQRR